MTDGQNRESTIPDKCVQPVTLFARSGNKKNISKEIGKKCHKSKKRVNSNPRSSGASASRHLDQIGSGSAQSFTFRKSRRNRGISFNPSLRINSTLRLPHTKVVMRNVCSTGKNGTDEEMLRLIQDLISTFNCSISSGNDSFHVECQKKCRFNEVDIPLLPLVLEKSSVRRILAMQQKDAGKNEKSDNTDILYNDMKEFKEEESKCREKEEHKKYVTEIVNADLNEVTSESENNDLLPNALTVRILYVVPPRISHRRGEISGRAYMILYPPLSLVDDPIPESAKNPNDKVVNDIISPSNCKNKMSIKVMSVYRSRAISRAHVLLRSTITRLSNLCKDDFLTDKKLERAQVEISPSQKIWKCDVPLITSCKSKKGNGFGFNLAKYDTTLKQSEDFQKFIEEKAIEQENLSNRPKPTPGGLRISSDLRRDESSLLSSAMEHKDELTLSNQKTLLVEDGQPLAAIVLHLREKKLQKKKSNVGSKKSLLGLTSTLTYSLEGDPQTIVKNCSSNGLGGIKVNKSDFSAKKSSYSGKKSLPGVIKNDCDETKEWKNNSTFHSEDKNIAKTQTHRTSKKVSDFCGLKKSHQSSKHQGRTMKSNQNALMTVMSQTPKILKKRN